MTQARLQFSNLTRILTIATSVFALAACGGGGGASARGSFIGAPPPGPYAATGTDNAGDQPVAVQATDTLRFTPNTFTAPQGAKVTLNVNNAGGAAHNFISPSLGVNQAIDIPSGKTTTVTFSAPSQAGMYAFWCNLPGHAEAGMTGAVTVVVK